MSACNVEVASWENPPPLPENDVEEDVLAGEFQGVCLRCQKDMDRQLQLSPDSYPVPKFSYFDIISIIFMTIFLQER